MPNIKITNTVIDTVDIPYPDNEYWEFVGKKKIPSKKAKSNYINLFKDSPFINRDCARNIRVIKHCNMCLHYFECLEKGESINPKYKS